MVLIIQYWLNGRLEISLFLCIGTRLIATYAIQALLQGQRVLRHLLDVLPLMVSEPSSRSSLQSAQDLSKPVWSRQPALMTRQLNRGMPWQGVKPMTDATGFTWHIQCAWLPSMTTIPFFILLLRSICFPDLSCTNHPLKPPSN